MLSGKRIAVVMPAYNAAKTLEKTVSELSDLVDIRILVDDKSSDKTIEVARRLGLRIFAHAENYGYGRNPTDVLSRGAGGRGGYRSDGASGLPVHTAAGDGDGQHDRVWRV